MRAFLLVESYGLWEYRPWMGNDEKFSCSPNIPRYHTGKLIESVVYCLNTYV